MYVIEFVCCSGVFCVLYVDVVCCVCVVGVVGLWLYVEIENECV